MDLISFHIRVLEEKLPDIRSGPEQVPGTEAGQEQISERSGRRPSR
jgi:hypothetical protein